MKNVFTLIIWRVEDLQHQQNLTFLEINYYFPFGGIWKLWCMQITETWNCYCSVLHTVITFKFGAYNWWEKTTIQGSQKVIHDNAYLHVALLTQKSKWNWDRKSFSCCLFTKFGTISLSFVSVNTHLLKKLNISLIFKIPLTIFCWSQNH